MNAIQHNLPNSSKRILITDDDAALRMVAREVLEAEGYSVIEAENGQHAIQQMQQQSCDAVLLDAKMPVKDGFTTCSELRAISSAKSVPIIIATGLDDDSSVDKAFNSGASDYVNKPINWSILKRKVRALIDEHERASTLQQQAEELDATILESGDFAVVLNDEGVIQELVNFKRTPAKIKHLLIAGDCLFDQLAEFDIREISQSWSQFKQGQKSKTFVVAQFDDSSEQFVLEGRFVAGGGGKKFCLFKDHTQSYQSERAVFNLAYFDDTTGAANYLLVREHLKGLIEEASETEHLVGVIRILFPQINNYESRLGSEGVKQLVCTCLKRIENMAENYPVVSETPMVETPMVGFDSNNEFMVALPDVGSDEVLKAELASLLTALEEPIDVDGYFVHLNPTIGAATQKESGNRTEVLVTNAGIALHSNNFKQKQCRVFNSQLQNDIQQQNRIERLLRKDLEEQKLFLHYQPKFSTGSLDLTGMEALIRWNNPKLGMVSPAVFIPIIESANLVSQLSELVIHKSLLQAQLWQQLDINVPISINLNSKDLNNRHLVQHLIGQIQQQGVMPATLQVEVTESIMMDVNGIAIRHLHELRELGIKVAVDDFGTGYSSFSYLKSLPVDILKIDKSFIDNIEHDETSRAIARAIITVAHDLKLEVVAEGVETQEQLAILKQLNCDTVQGYLTGKPVAPKDFMQHFMTNWPS